MVHHALCNVIEPIFEQTFVSDSYANRKGKGTHQGINCYQKLSRRFPYVLKCDVRKFFPSLDHLILKKIIRRKIGCQATLQLIDRIIDNSNPQEEHFAYFPGDDLFTPHERRRGLPIGNLTSQCWANVYLNAFDHFVKITLRAPGYLRYVDDFVLFADSKEQLWQWKRDIEAYLAGLRLMLHPHKTQVYCVADGVPFLGFQVWPYYRMVQKSKVKRFRRHLRRQVRSMQTGRLHPDRLEAMLNSWLGHIRFGQSRRLEKQVFNELHQLGVMVAIHPKGSWRVLERPRRDRSHPVPKIGIKIGA